MHPIARVLAVAYVALAVLGALVYVAATANYVDVTEVRDTIEGYVAVTRVALNWTGDASQPAKVLVSINVTDPGKVAILVLGTDFQLDMYNPADAQAWYVEADLQTIYVTAGGFSLPREAGLVVLPGETRAVVTIATVDVSRMDRFDRPDGAGRYHPVVWEPRIVYTFRDFTFQVPDIAYVPSHYEAAGVLPGGP